MKCFLILIGGYLSSFAVALGLVNSDLWDDGTDSVLQARRPNNHFNLTPRSYQLHYRRGGLIPSSGPSRQAASQYNAPLSPERPATSSQKDSSQTQRAPPAKSRSRARINKDVPLARASIHAKGSAALRALSPTSFEDTYVGPGKEGGLNIAHPKTVLAGGTVQGTPGTPLPNAGEQSITDHPLVAKGNARAVLGHVSAPEGGKGHIRIETPKGAEEFEVPGGTSMRKTGKAAKLGEQAEVTASVTHGGRVRVIGGPTKKALKELF